MIGCSDSNTSGPGGPPLDDVTLSVASVTSLTRVYLDRLPDAGAGEESPYSVEILGFDAVLEMPVEVDETGPFFFAPFHPETPEQGGTVTLQVAGEGERSPELLLDVQALPDAPGAFASLVDSLSTHIDRHAFRLGSSLEALRSMAFEDAPPALLPLKYALSFVDDPGNPNSLTAMADGQSAYLNADAVRLLDQLFGYAALENLVRLENAAIEELDPPGTSNTGLALPLAQLPPIQNKSLALKAGGCIEFESDIADAAALSAAMWEAKFADIAISGDAGATLGALGAVLAVGTVVTGPAAPAFAVAGAATAAWQASRQTLAGLNPSHLVSITAQYDKTRYNEDSVDEGSYSNVVVVAASTGWSGDQALFDAVTTAIGGAATARQVAKIAEASYLSAATAATLSVTGSTYLGAREGGVVEVCPQQWTIDISSPLWSEARSVTGKFQVATGAQTYKPLMAGDDFISVSNIPSKFGQERIDVDKDVTVEEIRVIANANPRFVTTPGETVQITAQIQHADNESLSWETAAGMWTDGMGDATNGPTTRPLETPKSKSAYPFVVTVESLSRQGPRESGSPTRKDTITVRLEQDITVSPPNPCVENAKNEQFTAIQADEPTNDVIWSLETTGGGPSSLGSIGSTTGLYTAPGAGSGMAVVVATSVESPDARGTTVVEVGACSCRWNLDIQTFAPDSGPFASHAFPSFGGFFSMTFQNDASTGANIQAFTDPVAPNQTGVYMPEGFAYANNSRACASTDDPEDNTPFTLTITKNNEATLEGSVQGTCVEAVNGEAVYHDFIITFRSADLASAGEICGE